MVARVLKAIEMMVSGDGGCQRGFGNGIFWTSLPYHFNFKD